MDTTAKVPDLGLKPGEHGRYVIRTEKWGERLVAYGVWDRETGEAIDTYTSHQGAGTLAHWLNCGWPLDKARREADGKHAWAFMN